MAKEYRLDWVIGAKMDGNFRAAFQSAAAPLRELQREIQAVNRAQSDVSSYQRLQSAVTNTTAKLQNLERQHDLLQREIRETGTSTASLEREDLKLQQRIDNTRAALENQQERLSSTGAALREAGVDMSNLSGESARLSERLGELRQSQDEAANAAQNFGGTASEAFEAAASALAAAGIAEGVKRVTEAFMECVNVAGDFESAMSTVEALSGASGAEMAALNAQAKELGAQTKFTAQESADAMGYMAMAGWDAMEMMSDMDGVIDLAAASGEDLAMVSDVVTDSLTAFGLTAADTTHFADVLAQTATNSNTNVAIMGETFKNAASVAGALGYSIEDIAMAVGLMANNGVKGSVAGTALRNTFNGLLEGATLTSQAFGEYEYSAVKADGSMKSFSDTISELRGRFSLMTEAERVNNAMTIAGMRGYNGLLAILNATDEDYRSLTESINNCSGAAKKMADIKLDNFKGQVTLMKSAFDALKTSTGEQLTPMLEGMAEGATALFGALDKLVQQNPGLVSGIATFTTVMGGAVTAMTAFAAISKAVKVLDLATMFAGPVGVAFKAVAAITAVASTVVAFNAESKKAEDISTKLTATSRAQEKQLEELNAEYDRYVQASETSSYAAQELKWQIDDLNEAYESGKQTIEEYDAAHEEFISGYDEWKKSLEENEKGLKNEEESIDALIVKLEELSATSESAARNQFAIEEISSHLNESVPGIDVSAADFKGGNADGLIRYMKATAKAQAERKRLEQSMTDYSSALAKRSEAKAAMDADAENVKAATEAYNAAKAEYMAAQDFATGYNIREDMEGLAAELEHYQSILDSSTAKYNDASAAVSRYEGALGGLVSAQQNADNSAQTALDNALENMNTLRQKYDEAYSEALTNIQEQYTLWETPPVVNPTDSDIITKNLESQTTYLANYETNLSKLGRHTGEIKGLSEVMKELGSSADDVNLVAGLVKDIESGNTTKVQAMVDAWKNLQEQQKKTAETIGEVKTDFITSVEAMEKSVEDAVHDMDMSKEATEAAENTIEAYKSAAELSIGPVQTAYQNLAKAAQNGLNSVQLQMPTVQTTTTTRTTTVTSTKTVDAWQRLPTRHAQGGILTEPHLGLVAEDGPEAVIPLKASMRMRGAEIWAKAGEFMGLLPDNLSETKFDMLKPGALPLDLQLNRSWQPDEGKTQYVYFAPELLQRLYSVPETEAIPDWAVSRNAEPEAFAPARMEARSESNITVTPHIQVTFQVNGSESTNGLRAFAESSEFKETITNAVNEAMEDALRSVFA